MWAWPYSRFKASRILRTVGRDSFRTWSVFNNTGQKCATQILSRTKHYTAKLGSVLCTLFAGFCWQYRTYNERTKYAAGFSSVLDSFPFFLLFGICLHFLGDLTAMFPVSDIKWYKKAWQ